jgi:hypothetical protein
MPPYVCLDTASAFVISVPFSPVPGKDTEGESQWFRSAAEPRLLWTWFFPWFQTPSFRAASDRKADGHSAAARRAVSESSVPPGWDFGGGVSVSAASSLVASVVADPGEKLRQGPELAAKESVQPAAPWIRGPEVSVVSAVSRPVSALPVAVLPAGVQPGCSEIPSCAICPTTAPLLLFPAADRWESRPAPS